MPGFKKPPRFKEIDLYCMEAGDFFLDTDRGDIADTQDDFYRAFIQRVDTRMSSGKGDWRLQPQIGAGLTDFVGRRNSAELARFIKQRVYTELLQDDLMRAGELTVEVLPITATKVAIGVIVVPPGSVQSITRMYTYDTRDNKVDVRSV